MIKKSIPGAGIIGHIVGFTVGIGVVRLFFMDEWKAGSWVTAVGVGIWFGIASIIKYVLTVRPTDHEESAEVDL
jgi:hypothetical protein